MKKILFGVAALGLLGLAGAGIGLKAQDTVEAKADGASHTVYCAISNDTLSSYTLKLNVQLGDTAWNQQNMTQIADDAFYADCSIFSASFVDVYGGIKKIQFQLYNGETQISTVTAQDENWDTTFKYDNKIYNYSTSTWSGEDYTPASPLTYRTITKLAVEFVDDIAGEPADWDLGSDSVIDGSTYATPNPTYKHLERFDGWYTDAACTSEYVAGTVSSDLTLYAKYTRLTVDSYFYWTSKDSTDMTHIYFFNEYSPVAWPGTALSEYKVSETLSFHNQGALYRIPVPSSGVIKAVINNNNNVKTIDITIVSGSFYYTYYDHESNGTYFYNYSANADAAAAADLVSEVEIARNAVREASGAVADYSICGIDPADAGSFYNTYFAMSSDVKAYVNDSNITTYVDKDPSKGEGTIQYSDIMAQLKENAKNAGVKVNGVSYIENMGDTGNSFGLAALIATGTVIGIASVFIIRKRRAE